MCIWNCSVEDHHCDFCAYEICKDRGAKTEGRLHPEDYINIMEEVTGLTIRGDHRLAEKVWARNMVAYQMFLDGFDNAAIAKTIGKNRCTIIHAVGKVQDMIDAPSFYPKEMAVWREFKKSLNLRQNT